MSPVSFTDAASTNSKMTALFCVYDHFILFQHGVQLLFNRYRAFRRARSCDCNMIRQESQIPGREHLGQRWGNLGDIFGLLWFLWSTVSNCWQCWGHLGVILGRLGGYLGPPWGYLGSCWGYVGAIFGPLGASLSTYSLNVNNTYLMKMLKSFSLGPWQAKTHNHKTYTQACS